MKATADLHRTPLPGHSQQDKESMSDHPPLPTRLTVAALVHWQGRFLLVEEEIAGQRRFNQPAGHVEPGEDLIQAACRELKEETGLTAAPTGWLGVYLFKPADSEATFVRTAVIFDLEKVARSAPSRIPTVTYWPVTGSAWRRLPSASPPCEAPGVAVYPGLSGRHPLAAVGPQGLHLSAIGRSFF